MEPRKITVTDSPNATGFTNHTNEFVDNGEQLELKYAVYGIFLSVFVFQILSLLLGYWGRPKRVLKDHMEWKNLCISWIHAFTVSVWIMLCLFYHPKLLQDLFFYQGYLLYYMDAFTIGYFIHDLMDIIYNNRCLKMWEIIIHHAVVLMCYINVVVSRFCLGYFVLALSPECNSVFLHARKLLQWYRIGYDHWFYRTICCCNIITFIIFRGLVFVFLSCSIYVNSQSFPQSHFIIFSLSLFVMNVIHVVLFWKLLKKDFIYFKYNWSKCTLNENNNTKCMKQK